jgi:glycosyltransferase involved in cell wall biosynthesis
MPSHSARGLLGSIMESRRMLEAVCALAPALCCDRVWVHFADMISNAAILPLAPTTAVPIEALHLRSGYAYPMRGGLRKVVQFHSRRATVCAPWEQSWHLDPIAFDDLSKDSKSIGLMPEPVEPPLAVTRGEARRELGLPESTRLLMVLGALDRRKGVVELLHGFRRRSPPDTALALMGPLYADIRHEVLVLARELGPTRCIVRDRVLSQREFGLAFAASTWQALTYRRHTGSSGILVRAAAHGVPVIASDFGWVGTATRRFMLGETCDPDNTASIADAIDRALQSMPSQSADAAAFVQFNTEANFIAHWGRRLREVAGLPADLAYCEWNGGSLTIDCPRAPNAKLPGERGTERADVL